MGVDGAYSLRWVGLSYCLQCDSIFKKNCGQYVQQETSNVGIQSHQPKHQNCVDHDSNTDFWRGILLFNLGSKYHFGGTQNGIWQVYCSDVFFDYCANHWIFARRYASVYNSRIVGFDIFDVDWRFARFYWRWN